MAQKRILQGTVVDKADRRYENAVVRLSAEMVKPQIHTTDDDGDFKFDLSNETKWPTGTYALEVFHPKLIVASKPEKIEIEAGKAPGPMKLVAVARNQVSAPAGWCFMVALFVLLAVVVSAYFYLHQSERFKVLAESPPFDEDLTRMLKVARDQVNNVPVAPESVAADSVQSAKEIYENLRQTEEDLFDERKQKVVDNLFAQAEESIKAENAQRLKTVLDNLINSVYRPRERFFWRYYPAQLLEVLFWALGATLIRLIFNTGGYLKDRTFFWNAIPHHLALIATAPILAVLIAFVISLVNINIGLGERAVQLNLSNVAISILIGALIGLAPWRAWEFMQNLADSLFKSLSGLFAGGTQTSSGGTQTPSGGTQTPSGGGSPP